MKISEDIKKLQNELQTISQQIHQPKERINTTKCPSQQRKLQHELKQLQWQALFNLEKIHNLEEK